MCKPRLSHPFLHVPDSFHFHFHLARCMLTVGLGPGLTNRSQISASHPPQEASLELILASPGPGWCSGVQGFILAGV